MSTISKPTIRLILSLFIALVLLVALYTSVQGGLSSKVLKAGQNSAQAHVVNGLKTNLNHDRSTIVELESAALQADMSSPHTGKGHGCQSEQRTDPGD